MASGIAPQAERQSADLFSDALTKGQSMTMEQVSALKALADSEMQNRLAAWMPLLQAQTARAQGEYGLIGQILGSAMQGLGSSLGG
jgi:predicted lipoprotein with Yx(FWY)xxD motif